MLQCYLIVLEEENITHLILKAFHPHPMENWHDFLTKLMAFIP